MFVKRRSVKKIDSSLTEGLMENRNSNQVEMRKKSFKRTISTGKEDNKKSGYNQPSTMNPITEGSNKTEDQGTEGYGWDFCIIVPNPAYVDGDGVTLSSTLTHDDYVREVDILERLEICGLQTYAFKSGDDDEILIKIRAPLQRLQQHAHVSPHIKFLLDEKMLETTIDDTTNPIVDDPNITAITPYEFIYAKYDKDRPELFALANRLNHPFSDLLRTKLLIDIIESDEEGCCGLNLRKMEKDGSQSVIASFPLHNQQQNDDLYRNWLNWSLQPWEQPIDDIKEYLGEKMALYFEFVGHYTTWLLPLSIAGILVILNIIVQGALSDINDALAGGYTIPFFCIFVSMWATLMIEYWKRRQVRKAMEWGMTDFEEEEAQRPEFKGEEVNSIINGQTEKYFDPMQKFRRICYSYFIISLLILVVVGLVCLVFYAQYYFTVEETDTTIATTGNTAASVASALQIIVMGMIYSGIAVDLNDNENHRTDTEYDDALIGKLFAFSFVNSYAALYFVAFIKTNLGEECKGNCMAELAYQLTIIFASQLTLSKVSTYFSLVVKRKLKERAEAQEYEEAAARGQQLKPPSPMELESRLIQYDETLDIIEDYATIFVQFGYVTLFVSACPLAPLLAYVSNWIEIRSDGFKMLRMTRRVIPVGAEDIGTWLIIMQLTSIIAVITNAGIICYTMDLIATSGVAKIWIFIGFQYMILVIMFIFSEVVDDIPEEVQIQIDRQNYLRERLDMDPETLQKKDARRGSGVSRPAYSNFLSASVKIHDADEEEEV